MIQASMLERYAQLVNRKRELESEIKTMQPEMQALEGMLLEHFAEQGVQSVKTASGFTVYLRGQWWARPKDGDYAHAVDALRTAGLDDMVKETVNVQTLSAWVREIKKEDSEAPLPHGLDEAIATTQQFNVLVRKA